MTFLQTRVDNPGSIEAQGPQRGSSLTPDILMKASRRVDWRFLLPDPNLENVAYIGPQNDSLITSLKIICRSLSIIKPIDLQSRSSAGYGLIIALDPTHHTLQKVVNRVNPGGYLYIEAHNPLFSARKSKIPVLLSGIGRTGLRSPGGYVSATRRLGFEDVKVHFHWPDFSNCKKIIPLDDYGALRYTFLQGGQSFESRLMAIVGRLLQMSGLLPLVIPCFSVLARRAGT